MNQFFFYRLVDKYLDGTASEEERRFVEASYEALSQREGMSMSREKQNELREILYQKILAGMEPAIEEECPPAEREGPGEAPWWKRPWRMAVAAAIVVLLGTFCWYIVSNRQVAHELAGGMEKNYRSDVIPAHQGAMLILGDSTVVRLDSVANGRVAGQGGTELVKQDGTLAYAMGSKGGEVVFNTLATGKGYIYQLKLPDGTKVWLDAMSSIRYPTAFVGKDRVVTVVGQAYFEVASDAARPFRVVTGGQTIDVLGTRFNVNAYDAVTKTTLLEGALRVSAGGKGVVLSPGQQAQVDGGAGSEKPEGRQTADRIRVQDGANLDEAMAWKNGFFRFNGSPIEDIMKEVSRWYDIEVVFHDRISETFVARISRDLPLSRLLNILEMTRQVGFTVEGNKVTVWSKR